MTDKVDPTQGGDAQAYMIAQAIRQHGVVGDGWIAESSTAYAADHPASGLSGAPLNAFNHAASSGLDVTIDTGEAFIGGAWVARDTQTTVSLADNTTGQTVYVGWDYNATDVVKVGLDAAFDARDPRIPAWDFDTASGAVSASTDRRTLGHSTNLAQTNLQAGSSLERFLMTAVSDSTVGTPGDHSGELFRASDGNSDLLMSVGSVGSERMNLAYNAYHDGSDWRRINGTNKAFRLVFGGGSGGSGIVLETAPSGTADSIITWDTAFDLDETGWRDGNDNQVYDAANDEVPQARQGGPAGSLSAYPLAPADISDGSGSGLDADTVDGKHASEIGGAGVWSVVDTHSDTNNGTIFDWDSGTLSTIYDIWRVEVMVYSHAASDLYNELYCRVNGVSSSLYQYTSVDGDAGVVHQDDQNRWQDIAKTEGTDGTDVYNAAGHAEVTIRGGAIPGAPAGTNYPTITANSGGWHRHPQLENGYLESDEPQVTRIRLYSERNMTGKIRLLGKDI